MPIRLRATYGSIRSNRTQVRNTWTLAEMENAFLKDIGISRVEIQFAVRTFDNPLSFPMSAREAKAGGW